MMPLAFQLAFQASLPWGWVALAFLVSAAVLWLAYRRLYHLYPKNQARVLLGLKTAAVAVLLAGLLRPAIVLEQRDLNNARVILLVDESRSMATRDGPLGQPRLDAARRAAVDTLLPTLKRDLLVTPAAFSTAVRVLDDPKSLEAAGDGTDIPGALLDGSRSLAGNGGVGAFVLVTDGGDTATLPVGLAFPAPVFALAVGTDLSGADDLGIGPLECPEKVDARTDFELAVEVAATGRPEFFAQLAALKLTLSEGEHSLAAQPVSLAADRSRQRVVFRVAAGEPGIRRFKLALPLFESEAATLNNEREITVEVRDPALRVLYHAARLGQNFKPLRNALKADPGIQFTSLLRLGPDKFLLQGQRPEDKLNNEFPTKPELLRPFKCVILSDCEASELSPDGQRALEQYVSNGGALIVTGGSQALGRGGWSASPLAGAFPWQIADSEPPFRTEAVALELTPQGQAHAIFKDLTAPLASGGRLAKISGYNLPGPLRPGAQALLLAAPSGGERSALVALHRYGKGKVLGIATPNLWTWNDEGPEGAKVFSAFWRQSLRFLADSQDGGGLLSLTTDRSGRYPPGARAAISARVLDRTLQPLRSATRNAVLKRLDGSTVSSVSFREESVAGAYAAQVDLASPGAYRLQVTALDASGPLETRELLLEVGAGTGEGSRPAVNLAYLEELARRSGGAVLPVEKAAELAERIQEGVKATVRRQELSLLWDTPWYYLLFLGLCTAEWIARRRMNLI